MDRGNLPPELADLSDAELSNEAMATLDRADQALENGDPVTYQMEMEKLRVILEALSSDSATPAPAATPGN